MKCPLLIGPRPTKKKEKQKQKPTQKSHSVTQQFLFFWIWRQMKFGGFSREITFTDFTASVHYFLLVYI